MSLDEMRLFAGIGLFAAPIPIIFAFGCPGTLTTFLAGAMAVCFVLDAMFLVATRRA